jgi:hypothetical protein
MYKNNEVPHMKQRRPAWTRAVDIFLRICHIGVTSVLLGGAVLQVPMTQLFIWHNLTISTGCALVISEVYHCRHWLYQGRGAMALIHIGLLGGIHLRPDMITPILITVLVFGVVGSHMPKNLRYWSFVHRRVVD